MRSFDITVYEDQFKVLTNDVDFKQNIRASAVLNIFQEVASAHAEILNVGFDAMKERNMFWVLSRIKFAIKKMPKYLDDLRVVTWPIKPNGAYYERDYAIYDKKTETPCIFATSIWCVLNSETHALLPAKSLDIMDLEYKENRAMETKIPKLATGEFVEFSYEKQIFQSDLDFNVHVNNTRYADICLDCFNIEFLKEREIEEFQINYIKETVFGAKIKMEARKVNENCYTVLGKNELGETSFSCGVKFKYRP